MIVSKKDNITIITQEHASVPEMVKKIKESFDMFNNEHIILDLTSVKKLIAQDLIAFHEISTIHRAGKHSFVIVSNTADAEVIPDEIMVVPTLQEAFDLIEMEDMERDLGF